MHDAAPGHPARCASSRKTATSTKKTTTPMPLPAAAVDKDGEDDEYEDVEPVPGRAR